MFDKVAEITQKYIGQGSDAAFARSLGLPSFKRQHVFNWKRGKQIPNTETLIKVIISPTASPHAKAWANEIMTAIFQETK